MDHGTNQDFRIGIRVATIKRFVTPATAVILQQWWAYLALNAGNVLFLKVTAIILHVSFKRTTLHIFTDLRQSILHFLNSWRVNRKVGWYKIIYLQPKLSHDREPYRGIDCHSWQFPSAVVKDRNHLRRVSPFIVVRYFRITVLSNNDPVHPT